MSERYVLWGRRYVKDGVQKKREYGAKTRDGGVFTVNVSPERSVQKLQASNPEKKGTCVPDCTAETTVLSGRLFEHLEVKSEW